MVYRKSFIEDQEDGPSGFIKESLEGDGIVRGDPVGIHQEAAGRKACAAEDCSGKGGLAVALERDVLDCLAEQDSTICCIEGFDSDIHGQQPPADRCRTRVGILPTRNRQHSTAG